MRVLPHRTPSHLGERLLEDFLVPIGLTQRELANALHVLHQQVNDLIKGKRGRTPKTVLKLTKFFEVSANCWMKLQLRRGLYPAHQVEASDLEKTNSYVA